VTDTDDLVQDALLQTLKRLGAFESRHPGALQAYLRQAVMNRMRDELRRQARAPGRADVADADVSARSRVEEAVGAETMAAYDQALRRLNPEEREAVIGRVELGLNYGELALALEKPTPDAARKTTQRALVRLAQEMEREG
jgi:RNA polymerase sigma factor (sigma-70 family)